MKIVDKIQKLSLKKKFDANEITFSECPLYKKKWVTVHSQQVRVYVSPTGDDLKGLGIEVSPLQTIQQGIDVVNEGGHVVLAPATYKGLGNIDLDFKGKALTLRSIEPRDTKTVTKTVIDCKGTAANKHRAIYFHDGEEANSVVSGLTIINGYHERGGAIWCESSPTIKNCTFIHNNASNYGGGVYCYKSDATIINCTFSGNNASLIGGGLYCGYDSNVILTNSILWNNYSASGHEIAVSIDSPPSALTVSYCDVDGGLADVFIDSGCSVDWKPGNIDEDPCFVDEAKDDLHLQSKNKQWKDGVGWRKGKHTSPCVDKGNPGTGPGNEPNVPTNIRIDIGSYGGTTKASIPPKGWGLRADIDNNGRVDLIDFALFAENWGQTSNDLPANLDFSQTVDFSDFKLFCNDWLKRTIQ
jgi:hypothetical protein